MDQYTETTTTSYKGRISYAIAGLVFAPFFCIIAFFALKFGEIRHAETTFGLKDVFKEVKSSKKAGQGDLFFISGPIEAPNKPLVDDEFGVEIKALKLYRKVYQRQWVEKKKTKKKKGSMGQEKKETTYTYSEKWVSDYTNFSSRHHKDIRYNSDLFKYKEGHENPKKWAYRSILFTHPSLALSGYTLDERLHEVLLDFEQHNANPSLFKTIRQAVVDSLSTVECPNSEELYLQINKIKNSKESDRFGHAVSSSNNTVNAKGYRSSSGGSSDKTFSAFIGIGTPEQPSIGDIRIEYWHIPSKNYTAVGQKTHSVIKAIERDSLFIRSETSCGGHYHTDGYFGMLFTGTKNKREIFKTAHKENDIFFVLLRFIGLLFMVGGFAIFGNPLRLIFGWIPFLGPIWEKVVFKIMQVLGTFTALSISGFYFLKHNSVFNLTIYDLYFAVGVLLFLIFCNNLRTSVSSGGEEVFSEDF